MSLYNALFGVNTAAPVLLAVLDLKSSNVPRFRDCYIDENEIVIYTRTGGGNREYYESEASCRENYPEYFAEGEEIPTGPWNDDLRKHPLYVRDYDDDYDATYAYFRFKFPEAYAADLTAFAANHPTHTPSEKWAAMLKSLSPTKE